MVRENRRQTLEDLTNKFSNTSVDNLSSRTVRRRLFESGYKRRVISKKISVRKENRAHRCSFCRQKLTWTVRNNWCKVIFSDETKVMIGADKKIYVWRRCNERVYPECTGIMCDREKQGTISAMFWCCITYNGVGTIIPINGNMNSVKYIETLDNYLWPVVAKNFGNSAHGSFRRITLLGMCQDNVTPGKLTSYSHFAMVCIESKHKRYRKCLESSENSH
jgi:hypothetical protein